jgi:hypothetical protein
MVRLGRRPSGTLSIYTAQRPDLLPWWTRRVVATRTAARWNGCGDGCADERQTQAVTGLDRFARAMGNPVLAASARPIMVVAVGKTLRFCTPDTLPSG